MKTKRTDIVQENIQIIKRNLYLIVVLFFVNKR